MLKIQVERFDESQSTEIGMVIELILISCKTLKVRETSKTKVLQLPAAGVRHG